MGSAYGRVARLWRFTAAGERAAWKVQPGSKRTVAVAEDAGGSETERVADAVRVAVMDGGTACGGASW